jgi:hypothetical protein
MQENLKDILSHLSTEIDQETLLMYLQGKLSAEKQHEVEKMMMDNEFAADAMEGLQQFDDKHKMSAMVAQLNRDLKKKTARKNAAREKRKVFAEPWIIISLVILLLLIVISYVILHMHLKR